MVQHWIVMQEIVGSSLLESFSISASERQLMCCQMLHLDVSFIAQFQQVSHLDPRQCKCQIKH
jgi:hypothetical protein